MTTETLLRRKPLDVPEGDWSEVASKADSLLGYGVLKARVRPSSVALVLSQMEYAPFDPESVRAYQLSKIKGTRSSKVAKFLEASFWISACLLLASVISIFCVAAITNWSYQVWWPALSLAISCFMVVGSIHLTFQTNDRRWERVRIREYHEEVPADIIRVAVAIKERLLEADFFIESLVEERTKLRDPFLVLNIHGQNYYIEVWNEPSFKAKRLA